LRGADRRAPSPSSQTLSSRLSHFRFSHAVSPIRPDSVAAVLRRLGYLRGAPIRAEGASRHQPLHPVPLHSRPFSELCPTTSRLSAPYRGVRSIFMLCVPSPACVLSALARSSRPTREGKCRIPRASLTHSSDPRPSGEVSPLACSLTSVPLRSFACCL